MKKIEKMFHHSSSKTLENSGMDTRGPIYSPCTFNGKYSNLRLTASNVTNRRTSTRPQILRWYVCMLCMLTLQDKITSRRSALSASFRPPPSPPAHRTAAQARSPQRLALPGGSSTGWPCHGGSPNMGRRIPRGAAGL
jgi:hypothetical protein